MQKAIEEERLKSIFSKPSSKPKGVVITETRNMTKVSCCGRHVLPHAISAPSKG